MQPITIKVKRFRNVRRAAALVNALFVVTSGFWILKQLRIERELNRALTLKSYTAITTPEGTNILSSIGPDAIPTFLRWSSGRQPFWHKVVNPIREKLNLPALPYDISGNREKARAGFLFLRARAVNAVPTLLRRLADENPDTRRFSIHMLGAIGPAIGSDAFKQMTNCLTDPEDNVRNDVLWSLQYQRSDEYPPEMLLPVFVSGLKDSHERARQNAMIGLARLGTNASPARAEIEKALEDPDTGVSHWAKQWINGQYLK